MASIGHVFVGMAAGSIFARAESPRWRAAWMIRFSALSLLPDLDAIAFVLRIPYDAPWGHRGAMHSPFFALLVAAAFAAIFAANGWRGKKLLRVFLWGFFVTASHGVLDALTDGGRGVEFGFPFSNARYFFPWRPLPVAPIGAGLLRSEGLHVMAFESLVLAPLLIVAFWPWGRRRITYQ